MLEPPLDYPKQRRQLNAKYRFEPVAGYERLGQQAPASIWRAYLWIFAGGLLYSFGVIFHAWQRLRFQNVIWHCFVLLGAACHYTAVLDLVLA